MKYAAINSLYVRVDSLLVACNENQIGKTFIPLAKKSHIIMSPQRGICHLDKKRQLNYRVQEIRELEEIFMEYSVRVLATWGLLKNMALSKMITR